MDVHIGIGFADDGVIAGAYLAGTLDVDVHDNVDALLKEVDDVRFKRAVTIAVDGGVFQEFSGVRLGCEGVHGEEVIIESVTLSFARMACRAGDGVTAETGIGGPAAEGCFTGT